jgi:acetyltransferase
MMEETKIYKMLKGFRNRPAANLLQVEETIVRFSNIIVDFPEISEMDVNPVVVSNGILSALDARIILDKNAFQEKVEKFPHMVILPYPTEYIIPWRLKDGTEVVIRPIRPEDEPLWLDFIKGLSEEALRNRFFYKLQEITHEMIIRYCNIDYDREVGLVAELSKDQQKRLIGISRIIMDPDKKNGEFAIVIADEYQGKGLGHKLVDMLIGISCDQGLDEIHGLVLSSNTKMLELCAGLGFNMRHLSGDETRVWMNLK